MLQIPLITKFDNFLRHILYCFTQTNTNTTNHFLLDFIPMPGLLWEQVYKSVLLCFSIIIGQFYDQSQKAENSSTNVAHDLSCKTFEIVGQHCLEPYLKLNKHILWFLQIYRRLSRYMQLGGSVPAFRSGIPLRYEIR